ncbi:hypothetical protein CDAR_564401 [Caerostris darwini]|uniref:Uncharacterized protein n=1 Tax=Caerostris darwini TaxID=1538125 RepID=A0AAV4TJ01_9ARAC|nr:hypothetical protein CDAR_564401 [Caerostris darwini]
MYRALLTTPSTLRDILDTQTAIVFLALEEEVAGQRKWLKPSSEEVWFGILGKEYYYGMEREKEGRQMGMITKKGPVQIHILSWRTLDSGP